MLFKLYYWFLTSGANAIGILLGVFMEQYTDANSTEIGLLYMSMPFIGIIFRPMICSLADRRQAHQKYLLVCLFVVAATYLPFVVIPLLGPQVYGAHPRLSFYALVTLKVFGDAAFGGAVSIGDSLAINYAKRINVDFSVYRVWGTISWMVFGVIIGQINEIWFMPKYVPAFIVLIVSTLMNMLVVYLWPQEYFRMVPQAELNEGAEGKDAEAKQSAMTKSLLPREVVWAHAKKQLWLLVTLRCMSRQAQISDASGLEAQRAKSLGAADRTQRNQANNDELGKRTQLQILWLLMRRDTRIIFYLLLFVCAGFTVVPLSFLFMSLAQICHDGNRCNFSQLGGLLQVSMAFAETILFVYIKRVLASIGRLNTIAFAFFLTMLKYTFYGTIWPSLDPYFSLLSELSHGIIFGTYLTLMVEMGHLFANEVEHVIPELIEKQIISKDANTEMLKLSLKATMQAIIANASDGLGRGFGALIYGLIVDNFSYEALWLSIASGAGMVFIIIEVANVADKLLNFQLGLDTSFKKRQKEMNVNTQENGIVM